VQRSGNERRDNSYGQNMSILQMNEKSSHGRMNGVSRNLVVAIVNTTIALSLGGTAVFGDTSADSATKNSSEQTQDKAKVDSAATPADTTTATDVTTPSNSQTAKPESEAPHYNGEPSEPPKPVVTPPAKATPADRPDPKGQDAAVKLYSQGKFALAAKGLEKFIQDGTAAVSTHAYLAYCLYNMRQYRAALKQFDWVSKYSTKAISLQMSAERSGHFIRCRMAGKCPGGCLQADDPRWQHPAGLDPAKRWIKFSTKGGWEAVSDGHLGQLVVVEHGEMVNKGVCPICGGTGTVSVLHDGDPVPQ
jgi:TolA-binding protein